MSQWKEYKLGEISELRKEGFMPNSDMVFPYIGLEHIEPESLSLNGIGKSSDVTSQKFKFYPNDVLYGKLRPYFKKVLSPNFEGVCSTDIYVVKAKNGVNSKYLFYLLATDEFTQLANSGSTGTRMPRADWKHLSETLWHIPDYPTQTAIASILSSLDQKIELNNAINRNLEALAQALFKQWFVDFEYPNENGEPYKSSGGEMVESELGMIPKEWRVKRLKEILTIKRGGSPRPIQDFIAETGLPWVKISDATAISNPFLFSTKEYIKVEGLKKTILLKKGSLILSNSATPGLPKFLELDACIHDGWLHFQDIKDLSYNYLYLLFIHIRQNLIGQGNGSIFINLKTDILKDYPISIASIKILDDFNKAIEPIFEQIKALSKEVIELSNIRDIILPKLISGELEVKDINTVSV
jgi:type I restriction enzyme S subunit